MKKRLEGDSDGDGDGDRSSTHVGAVSNPIKGYFDLGGILLFV